MGRNITKEGSINITQDAFIELEGGSSHSNMKKQAYRR